MTADPPGDAGEVVELRTPEAVERAAAERDRIEEKVEAFAAFGDRVAELSADAGRRAGAAKPAAARSAQSAVVAGGASTQSVETTANVREAFRETVLPYAEPESPQQAMADELSPELTTALSPAAAGLTPGLKDQLLSRVERRRRECRLLADAIETERERLDELGEELGRIVDEVADADETPLLQLGFEELRERHDRLAELRERCDRLAADRQAAIRGARRDGLTGVRQSELLDHLYGDLRAAHPGLADLARLDAVLADCQRVVRDHLCSRV
ncbi:DUF7260 family protein [Halorussus sp. AFM4]|uniref:DUF7260 family protein n=1 Tax=Halorussus sp. AFM4 TaxID=3421651 RepID=UPI003EB92918